jgi:hypothetical protein
MFSGDCLGFARAGCDCGKGTRGPIRGEHIVGRGVPGRHDNGAPTRGKSLIGQLNRGSSAPLASGIFVPILCQRVLLPRFALRNWNKCCYVASCSERTQFAFKELPRRSLNPCPGRPLPAGPQGSRLPTPDHLPELNVSRLGLPQDDTFGRSGLNRPDVQNSPEGAGASAPVPKGCNHKPEN